MGATGPAKPRDHGPGRCAEDEGRLRAVGDVAGGDDVRGDQPAQPRPERVAGPPPLIPRVARVFEGGADELPGVGLADGDRVFACRGRPRGTARAATSTPATRGRQAEARGLGEAVEGVPHQGPPNCGAPPPETGAGACFSGGVRCFIWISAPASAGRVRGGDWFEALFGRVAVRVQDPASAVVLVQVPADGVVFSGRFRFLGCRGLGRRVQSSAGASVWRGGLFGPVLSAAADQPGRGARVGRRRAGRSRSPPLRRSSRS